MSRYSYVDLKKPTVISIRRPKTPGRADHVIMLFLTKI